MKIGHRRKSRRLVILVAAVAIIAAVLAVAWYQTNRSPAGGSDSRLAYLKILPGYAVLGSRNATVTIYQFGDFQCPTCDDWFKTQEPQVLQNLVDTGKANLVWRDFEYYGPDSTNASQAAYAAGEQGKFWQYYDALYANQGGINDGWASRAHLFTFAQLLGLNMTQFTQSFNSGKYLNMITTNFNDGKKLGITGTPTFFVVGPNGKVVEIAGDQPYSVFLDTVNSMMGG